MKRSLQELEAERAAEQLITDLGLATLPICPFSIAKKHDIEVVAKSSNDAGVSGFLMLRDNQFGIMYATHIKSDGFKRFSVAHELGHYFLPGHSDALFPSGQGLHQSHGGYLSGDPYERQADAFATALLMPEDLFVVALRDAGEGFEAIQKLAASCKTSITATAIRFAQHAEDPVAVVSSTGDTINWCFASEAIRKIQGIRMIKKGTVLPPGSATAKFNKVAANVSGANQTAAWTSLDDWFEHAPQVEMKEDVIGLGGYGRTLTVLYTSEPIDSDDGDDDD